MKHIGIKILAIFIILSSCLFLYGKYINTKQFKVNEIAIINESLPNDYNGFKILQISDILYGSSTTTDQLKKITEEVELIKPDIIIFTGDLFNSDIINENDQEKIIYYLEKMTAKLYKFAIYGDNDLKYENIYKDILEKSNFILLDNENKLIYNNSTYPLNIIGLTNTNDIDDLYQDYFNITLIHKPDEIKNILNSNIVFAGHSLGGQIKIPFIGGIKKIDGANTYYNNYYKVNDTLLYISNGIGTNGIKLRLFNTPSITLYRLYNY